jgi:hypothetical protein
MHPIQVGRACAGQPALLVCQRSEQTADAMTAVTAFGCEISVRCDPPWNSVMCECARWAIASSEAAVMIWSSVLSSLLSFASGVSLPDRPYAPGGEDGLALVAAGPEVRPASS